MKKLLLLIVLVLVAYVAWKWWHRSDEAAANRGQTMFYDRVWVDHLPRSESDGFRVFVALAHKPFGQFAQRTAWTGQWEAFRHQPRGDGQLELNYPHSNTKERVSYRAWKCNEPHFDFCLEMTGGKGAKKYFSQRGWEIHDADAAGAVEERLAHAN